MERIPQEYIEKALKGKKMVCKQTVRFQDKDFFGNNHRHTIEFEIYDGFAYCANFRGQELFLTYPMEEFVHLCTDMEESIRNFMGLDSTEKVLTTDILQSYCELHKI